MKGTYNMPVYEKRISERTLDITSRIIDLRVDNIDYVLNTLQGTPFKKLLSKFDNKVFNKRFETALREEVSNYIRVKKDDYTSSLTIEFYFFDRRSVSTPRPDNDFSETTYIEWDTETIMGIKLEADRIKADNVMEKCIQVVDRLIATKERLLEDKQSLQTMVQEYNAIAQQVKDFEDKYSYEVRQRLGLKF
jgi:hypothetical protein